MPMRPGSEPSHNSLGLALSDADMAAIAALDRGERLLTLNWGASDPGELLRRPGVRPRL